MATHSITVDIAESSYKILREAADSGEFASESEAIDDLIVDLLFDKIPEVGSPRYEAYEKRLMEAALAADDELGKNLASELTSEQVRAHLAEELANKT